MSIAHKPPCRPSPATTQQRVTAFHTHKTTGSFHTSSLRKEQPHVNGRDLQPIASPLLLSGVSACPQPDLRRTAGVLTGELRHSYIIGVIFNKPRFDFVGIVSFRNSFHWKET